MSLNFLQITTLLSTAGLAFVAGIHFLPIRSDVSKKNKDTPNTLNNPSGKNPSFKRDTNEESLLRDQVIKLAGVSKTEFRENYGLDTILNINDPNSRSSLLLNILKHIPSEKFPQIAEIFLNHKNLRRNEFELLIDQWIMKDPQAALKFAMSYSDDFRRREMIHRMLTTWASLDENLAVSWAKSELFNAVSDELYQVYAGALMKGIAPNNIALATEILNSMKFSETDVGPRTGELAMMDEMRKTLQEGIAGFHMDTQDLDRNPSAVDKRPVQASVEWLTKHVFKKDAKVVNEWLNSIDDGNLKRALPSIIGKELSALDPSISAEILLGIEDSEVRNQTLDEFSSHWEYEIRTDEDLKLGLDLSSKFPEAERAFLLKSVIKAYAATDPAKALELKKQMQNLPNQIELERGYLMGAVSTTEVGATIRRLLDLPQEQREELFPDVMSSWIKSDYSTASSWIHSNMAHVPASARDKVHLSLLHQNR